VIGAVREAGPGAPKRGGKHNHRQQKEDTGNLEPEDAAHPAKGTQKSTHATGNAARCLPGSLTGGPALSGSGWLRRRRVGSGFCAGSHALTGDAPGDPQANPQSAANGVRFHSVMMVAANLAEPVFRVGYRFAVARGQRRK
jgi:hypothetical protein